MRPSKSFSRSTKRLTTLLIDGDLFAYQLACGEEKTIEINGVHMLTADADTGRENLSLLIDGFKDRTGADRIVVALSDTENYRKTVMPTYKSNRDGVRRPMILGPLKDHLAATYETFIRPGLEADDVLGILATNPKVIPGDKIVVTEDKDLRQVPGLHWNPKKEGATKGQEPATVTAAQGQRYFFAQCLMGDRTDGYSGCPGIGEKRAYRLIDAIQSGQPVWPFIVEAYEKAGSTAEEALATARVARILQHDDYDYMKRRPILWTP